MRNDPENRTEIEVFNEIELDEHPRELTVLISRNYYSEDSETGRDLLSAFIETLLSKAASGNLVLFINGIGVKLLASSLMTELIASAGIVYICSDSLKAYDVDCEIEGNIVSLTSASFFEEVLKYRPSISI